MSANCVLQPEHNRRNRQHGQIVLTTLLIAGRHPPVLLQPIEQPLHLVALAIPFFAEGPPPPLVLLAGNHNANLVPAQVLPNALVIVRFVAGPALGPPLGPSAPPPLDRAPGH